MSKLGRQIERGIAKRKAKEMRSGVDAIRRLVAGADGLTSISQAISLLQEIGPAVEECRNAAVIAVQHAVSLERELDRERHVRRGVTAALVAHMVTAPDLDRIEAEVSAAWDQANPAPPLENADAASGE